MRKPFLSQHLNPSVQINYEWREFEGTYICVVYLYVLDAKRKEKINKYIFKKKYKRRKYINKYNIKK